VGRRIEHRLPLGTIRNLHPHQSHSRPSTKRQASMKLDSAAYRLTEWLQNIFTIVWVYEICQSSA
jgi:hypothetical protein